ncbi:DUF523 and DUF1722 domain-containing protein [Actinocorallia longicatena]|uniref:DUF523 and DUF1722 domain-containing protein n=1 Tax=Actinocorallia longicatena TaxID=111803 RepID=A0ABP6QC41_9ACTN
MRYNAGHSRCRFLTDELDRYVDWVRVCPEIEIGLGAPRPTIRLRTDGHLVGKEGTPDHTAAMHALADERLPGLADLDGYVLKSRSPSCALHGVPRYASGDDGERTDGQPVDRRGRGLFASRLTEEFPLLPVEEDGRLNDSGLREHFVERIFAGARLREFLDSDWKPGDLVAFHSRHKLQILAHDPVRYRESGRIVAQAGVRPHADLAADYRAVFLAAFATRAGRGRNVNALHHVLGPMSDRLNGSRRHGIVEAIEDYRQGRAPLSVPIALLRHNAEGEDHAYLADQTFLEPFPADLPLRHHL